MKLPPPTLTTLMIQPQPLEQMTTEEYRAELTITLERLKGLGFVIRWCASDIAMIGLPKSARAHAEKEISDQPILIEDRPEGRSGEGSDKGS